MPGIENRFTDFYWQNTKTEENSLWKNNICQRNTKHEDTGEIKAFS